MSTPEAILSAEEIAGALVKIAPDEPWPLVNGDWFTRLCVSHEALRRLVERLTAERDVAVRMVQGAERLYAIEKGRVAELTAEREGWRTAFTKEATP